MYYVITQGLTKPFFLRAPIYRLGAVKGNTLTAVCITFGACEFAWHMGNAISGHKLAVKVLIIDKALVYWILVHLLF